MEGKVITSILGVGRTGPSIPRAANAGSVRGLTTSWMGLRFIRAAPDSPYALFERNIERSRVAVEAVDSSTRAYTPAAVSKAHLIDDFVMFRGFNPPVAIKLAFKRPLSSQFHRRSPS